MATKKPKSQSPEPKLAKEESYLSIEDVVQATLRKFSLGDHAHRWDSGILREAKVVSADAEKGTMIFTLPILPAFCNVRQTLHGGCASTILDNLTSVAVIALADAEHVSVSRTLTVTFLRPVAQGTTVTVEAELVSVGRTMVNLKGLIRTEDGKVAVTCVHDKVIVSQRQPAGRREGKL